MKKTKFDLLLLLKKLKKNKSLANLNLLNTESQKLFKIQKKLDEMLSASKYPKNKLLTSNEIRQISNYQNQIQEKLTITHNRNQYINKEIKNNAKELVDVNKQTEKIKKKIDQIKKHSADYKEKNAEVTLINKVEM